MLDTRTFKGHDMSYSGFECMHELFSQIWIESIEEVLRDNLRSDMGSDRLSGKHTAIETQSQVFHTVLILRFLRTFPLYLGAIYVANDEPLKLIQNAFDKFSYEEADEIIFRGLNAWIYQDEDIENACIEYALEISTVYYKARVILKMCWDYYQPILPVYYEAKKGGNK